MKYLKTAVKPTLSLCLLLFVFSWINCGGAGKIQLDPESQGFYETARLIMTKQEKKIFNHLPDKESRQEFIKDFWQKRDPDPGTEINEFKEEFHRRIEYANERFMEGPPGWKTDRGRIYIYFGEPDKIEQAPFINTPDLKGALLWVYYRYNFAVYFVDRRGDGRYTIEPTPASLGGSLYGDFFGAMEMAKLGYFPRRKERAQKYMDFDLDYDKTKKELYISLPVEALSFKEDEDLLQVDLNFAFYIYKNKGREKEKIHHTRHFEATEEELLEMKEIVFTFSLALEPGKHFIDVIIEGNEGIGKARKIFEIKV